MQELEPRAGDELDRLIGRYARVRLDPSPAQTRRARAAIMDACGGCVLDMHHVGSTAIPGIAAKPVIAMMPLLRRHQVGFACVRPMEASRYKFRGDGGLSGRHYFIKCQPNQSPAEGPTTFTCTLGPP